MKTLRSHQRTAPKQKSRFPHKFWLWGGAIALTLLLCIFAPSDDTPTDHNGVIHIQRTRTNTPIPSTLPVPSAIKPRTSELKDPAPENVAAWHLRHEFKVQTADAFAALNYAPPPPPPAPKIIQPVLLPPPPPKPVPPPLVFEYLGKMNGHHTVQKGDDLFELISGQTIAQDYKVERISETEAVLIYLPLNAPQTLLLKTKDE